MILDILQKGGGGRHRAGYRPGAPLPKQTGHIPDTTKDLFSVRTRRTQGLRLRAFLPRPGAPSGLQRQRLRDNSADRSAVVGNAPGCYFDKAQ